MPIMHMTLEGDDLPAWVSNCCMCWPSLSTQACRPVHDDQQLGGHTNLRFVSDHAEHIVWHTAGAQSMLGTEDKKAGPTPHSFTPTRHGGRCTQSPGARIPTKWLEGRRQGGPTCCISWFWRGSLEGPFRRLPPQKCWSWGLEVTRRAHV